MAKRQFRIVTGFTGLLIATGAGGLLSDQGDGWVGSVYAQDAESWAAKEAAYKCLSALGANLALEALVPCWTSLERGELLVSVVGAGIRIALDCRIHDELMWVLAKVASGG